MASQATSTSTPTAATTLVVTVPILTIAPRCTFTVKYFGTDRNPALLNPLTGLACATLGWSVSGVQQVFLGRQSIPFTGSQRVCIRQTTTYTLSMTCGGRTMSRSYTLRFP